MRYFSVFRQDELESFTMMERWHQDGPPTNCVTPKRSAKRSQKALAGWRMDVLQLVTIPMLEVLLVYRKSTCFVESL